MSNLSEKPLDGKNFSKDELQERLIKMGVKLSDHLLETKSDFAQVYNSYVFKSKFNNYIKDLLKKDTKSKDNKKIEKSKQKENKPKAYEKVVEQGKKKTELIVQKVLEKPKNNLNLEGGKPEINNGKLYDYLFNKRSNKKNLSNEKNKSDGKINNIVNKLLEDNTHSEKKAVTKFLKNLTKKDENESNRKKDSSMTNFTLGKPSNSGNVESLFTINNDVVVKNLDLNNKRDNSQGKNFLSKTNEVSNNNSLFKTLGLENKEERPFVSQTPKQVNTLSLSSNNKKANSSISISKSKEFSTAEPFCFKKFMENDIVKGISPCFLLKSGISITIVGLICYVLTKQELLEDLKNFIRNGLSLPVNLDPLSYFLIALMVLALMYIVYCIYKRHSSFKIACSDYSYLTNEYFSKEAIENGRSLSISEPNLIYLLSNRNKMTPNLYHYDVYHMVRSFIIKDDHFTMTKENRQIYINRVVPKDDDILVVDSLDLVEN